MLRRTASLSVVALLILAGCVTPQGGTQLNMVSTEEEIQLGNRMSAEVEKEEKRLNSPIIQNYVAEIGGRLAKQAPRQDVPYQFTVIDNPDVVNAFALPGGHMYIYTGLMLICDNEAQLASVMAHEIGHVAAYHHGESITRQMNAELLQSILLGRSQSELVSISSKVAGALGTSWFSRVQEREADRMGMDMLFRSGYKPEAMVDFMRKMAQYEQEQGGGNSPRFLQFFASHPATAERISNLDMLVQQYPLQLRNQSPTYFERYKTTVLNRLN